MDRLQFRNVNRLAFRLEVADLSRNHALARTQCVRETYDCLIEAGRFEMVARSDRLEGKSQQGVSCKNRHGFAELPMARESATAEVVVIHRRKVIMDQRVGMSELQGRSDADDWAMVLVVNGIRGDA